MKLEVQGRRPVGRSKKIWNKVVQKKHEEAKHHGRYGRGQKIVEATHITSKPRSGKLGTLNEDDDDDDDDESMVELKQCFQVILQ